MFNEVYFFPVLTISSRPKSLIKDDLPETKKNISTYLDFFRRKVNEDLFIVQIKTINILWSIR